MKICPRCGREFERLLALSRKDNKTMICDQCGQKIDFSGTEWTEKRQLGYAERGKCL